MADRTGPASTAPDQLEDEGRHPAPDEVGAEAREPDGQQSPEQARPRSRYRTATLALALLALLLTIAAVLLAVRVHQHGNREQGREDAVAAAEQQAVNVTSLSSKNVTEGLKRIADGATGTFKSQYDEQAARLEQAVTTAQVVSSGRVVDAAVETYDGDHATVMLILDGTVANKAQPTPQPRRYRMEVTVDRVDGRWLTSMLTVLS